MRRIASGELMDYLDNDAAIEIDYLLAQIEDLKERMRDELDVLGTDETEEEYVTVPICALEELLDWPLMGS
ncbi:MAG TPA: hypothetical protein VEX38_09790, partial [Fimbriimonadaceae bacterium]|nr:hypothetical protein [Fimbriimonadaceae bacterium]